MYLNIPNQKGMIVISRTEYEEMLKARYEEGVSDGVKIAQEAHKAKAKVTLGSDDKPVTMRNTVREVGNNAEQDE